MNENPSPVNNITPQNHLSDTTSESIAPPTDINVNLSEESFAQNILQTLQNSQIFYASKIIRKKGFLSLGWEWGILYLTDRHLIFVPKSLDKGSFFIYQRTPDFKYKTSKASATLKLQGYELISATNTKQTMSYQWDTLVNQWKPADSENIIKDFPAANSDDSGGGLFMSFGAGTQAASNDMVEAVGSVATVAGATKIFLSTHERIDAWKDSVLKGWGIQES